MDSALAPSFWHWRPSFSIGACRIEKAAKKKNKKLVPPKILTRALFSFKIFCKIDTVAISFVFDKYCLIMD